VDDLAIQRICNLKLRVLSGLVTDWPNEPYHHISNMTCKHFLGRDPIVDRKWQWQLERICEQFRLTPE
jgi:hypothetical protein